MTSIEIILDRQLRRWELDRALHAKASARDEPRPRLQPVITVSRQRGAGGTALAGMLAERFDYALLDRDVIDRICQSTGLKHRIIASLDEHAKSQLSIWFESMLAGRYVDADDYVRHLLEVIYSISQLGGVVVVGRGANFILGPERGFHVRVVAPRDARLRSLAEREKLSERDALRQVETSDHERAEFVRKVLGRDIDDPLGYDLVLNARSISMETAAGLVATAAREKFEKLRAGAGTR
ncbi:MAG: cytidylate kinase-like family protein [Candidatus Eisenbacteria bacterium]|nr:cytidylate kinase-like family protein [Candidatus Eisenbacteria bacterium]